MVGLWPDFGYSVFNPVGSLAQINIIRQRAAVDSIMYIYIYSSNIYSKYNLIGPGTVSQSSHSRSEDTQAKYTCETNLHKR